jgi:hypothetical protein
VIKLLFNVNDGLAILGLQTFEKSSGSQKLPLFIYQKINNCFSNRSRHRFRMGIAQVLMAN